MKNHDFNHGFSFNHSSRQTKVRWLAWKPCLAVRRGRELHMPSYLHQKFSKHFGELFSWQYELLEILF
jgi:hypothetical protein